MARAVVVMGVTGSGKSTIGRLLAERLGWDFEDADVYHPEANIAKMATGIPLDDRDRVPWLQTLRALIDERLDAERSLVLACSALKQDYRDVLSRSRGEVDFVYLKGSRELIGSRLQERTGHYMKPELLDSQFEALEEPKEALVVDINRSPEELVERLARELRTNR